MIDTTASAAGLVSGTDLIALVSQLTQTADTAAAAGPVPGAAPIMVAMWGPAAHALSCCDGAMLLLNSDNTGAAAATAHAALNAAIEARRFSMEAAPGTAALAATRAVREGHARPPGPSLPSSPPTSTRCADPAPLPPPDGQRQQSSHGP